MKEHWIYGTAAEEMEKAGNEFRKKENVKFTQTSFCLDNGRIRFLAVHFYEESANDLMGKKE